MQSAAEGVIQVLNGELVLDGGIIRAGGEGAVGVKMSGDSRVRVTGCEIDARSGLSPSALRTTRIWSSRRRAAGRDRRAP
ncbi:MAG: hypothetical protein ACLTSG_09935 [Lachnospiraceae bacterium]